MVLTCSGVPLNPFFAGRQTSTTCLKLVLALTGFPFAVFYSHTKIRR